MEVLDRLRASQPSLATKPASPASAGRFAIAVLAFCCLCWGLSFPVVQRCTMLCESAIGNPSAVLSTALRPTFNGWRFAAAAGVYLLLTCRQQRGYNRDEIRGGVVIGCLFYGGVLFQLFGLRYTVPSVSAFLTALAVVFAPLAQACLLRRAVSARLWLSVALALGGTLLLSLSGAAAAGAESFVQIPPLPFLGEILTTAGSVLFTAQILALDHYGRGANCTRLTFVMLVTAAVLGLLLGLVMGGSGIYSGHTLSFLARSGTFWWTFLTLVLLSCVLAMHLMNRYQPLLAPAIATVVYCLEPVFSTFFSVLMGAESLTAATLAGGGVIILAVLLIARNPATTALP